MERDPVNRQFIKAPLTPGSIREEQSHGGIYPFSGWKFQDPDRVASPDLVLKAPWNFRVEGYFKSPKIAIQVVSGAGYTFLDDDGLVGLLVSAGVADRNIVLPTAADNVGRLILIVKTDAGVGNVIVDGEGAETVDGQPTVTLNAQYLFVWVVTDGTEWIIVGAAP